MVTEIEFYSSKTLHALIHFLGIFRAEGYSELHNLTRATELGNLALKKLIV